MTNKAPVIIVAGIGRNTRAIGKNNELLWHVPADLKRFKALTVGHPIIMGRKTFESILAILGKPLPGRTNIVVTRDTHYAHEGVAVEHSFADALARAQAEDPTEVHIGGGAEIYKLALPYVSKLYLTLYDDDTAGDTYFPEFADDFTVTEEHPVTTHDNLSYQWVDYTRK